MIIWCPDCQDDVEIHSVEISHQYGDKTIETKVVISCPEGHAIDLYRQKDTVPAEHWHSPWGRDPKD